MLAIPKNLVYFFVLIIIFAFGAVFWIAYYEKDLQEFVSYDRTQEVVVVDPVFEVLQEVMPLDKFEVP